MYLGKFKKNVQHVNFSQISDDDSVTGMCITRGELWCATSGLGLLKFSKKSKK